MIGSGSENREALEKSAVVRKLAHPKYDSDADDYDVGVVTVAAPFVVSAVRKPIALVKAGEDAASHEPVVVSGWGVNRVSAFYLGSFLSSASQPILICKFREKCCS